MAKIADNDEEDIARWEPLNEVQLFILGFIHSTGSENPDFNQLYEAVTRKFGNYDFAKFKYHLDAISSDVGSALRPLFIAYKRDEFSTPRPLNTSPPLRYFLGRLAIAYLIKHDLI